MGRRPRTPHLDPQRLVDLLPHAELHVATRIREVLRWPTRLAEFLD